MKTVNAKGEPFDATDAQAIDLTPFVKRNRAWSGGAYPSWDWSEGVFAIRFPSKGKVVITAPLYSSGAACLPRECFSKHLYARLKKNAETFMAEVGFVVPDDHTGSVLYDRQIQDAFEKLERRRAKDALEKKLSDGDVEESKPARLLIPDCGTILRLTRDWTFTLHCEHRNKTLITGLGSKYEWDMCWPKDGSEPPTWTVTFRKGTVMTVDRIYLRKGAGDFSSLTFIVRSEPVAVAVRDGQEYQLTGKFRMPGTSGAVRFWAKLEDVNTMECVFVMETMKVKGKA